MGQVKSNSISPDENLTSPILFASVTDPPVGQVDEIFTCPCAIFTRPGWRDKGYCRALTVKSPAFTEVTPFIWVKKRGKGKVKVYLTIFAPDLWPWKLLDLHQLTKRVTCNDCSTGMFKILYVCLKFYILFEHYCGEVQVMSNVGTHSGAQSWKLLLY